MGTFDNKENSVFREGLVIFVVTGTQVSFDRLLKILDEWAETSKKHRIIAQTANSDLDFHNMSCYDFLEPDVFDKHFLNADIIIGHAGMGTIIKALENKKRLVVFPRLVKFNEHRNEHQLYTAKCFEKLNLINVAYNELELLGYLNDLEKIKDRERINPFAEKSLIDALSSFINK